MRPGPDPDGKDTRPALENFGWQIGQAGQSLTTSALAAGVVLVADLVHPGHMKQWHVFGSVGLYIATVAVFFRIERRQHRKRRALLPPDPFGSGRKALLVTAIVFCSPDASAGHALAGWLALAALVLGSTADGAWIAIVASRQRIGFWRALRQLVVKEREAQSRLWAVLIGRDPP